MARTIDWNKKAVKLLRKFISEERMDRLEWFNDEETETEYTLVWVDRNSPSGKQRFIVNKQTQKVVFVNY